MNGLYINLDRAQRRRARLEAELARFGLSDDYRRIRAFAESSPFRGCWKSHIKAMEEAATLGGPVHVIEDDVIFSARAVEFLRSGEAEKLLETYDVVFLSMWVDPEPAARFTYQSALRAAPEGGHTLLDMRRARLGAMDSYIVAPRSLARIASLMRSRLAQTPLIANDTFLGNLVKAGRINAVTLVPFLTCIDLETGTQSSIQKLGREQQENFVRLRTTFFVEPERQQAFPLSML